MFLLKPHFRNYRSMEINLRNVGYKMRGLLAAIAHAMQPPYKNQIYNLA
ncbi:hypothetical protein DB41_JD00010 [Neochlamydia sp. TUME1]|nr:hypothetical protein DB41_JD00010 [Neochlamydia sp. TUME1]